MTLSWHPLYLWWISKTVLKQVWVRGKFHTHHPFYHSSLIFGLLDLFEYGRWWRGGGDEKPVDGLLSTLSAVEVPWEYNPHLDLGYRKPWLYSFNFSAFVVNFCQQIASLPCSSISIFCRLAWPSWWPEFRSFSSSQRNPSIRNQWLHLHGG